MGWGRGEIAVLNYLYVDIINGITRMKYFIKKDTLISEIIQKSPRAIELLTEYGLSCINCPLRTIETLEMGAKNHGFSDKEIRKMLKEINARLT